MQVQNSSGFGAHLGANLNSTSMAAPTRIMALQAQVKVLMKKIQTLGESLTEIKNPVERKAVVKQIMLMQESIRLLQAQIAELEKRAGRKLQERLDPDKAEKADKPDGYGL